MTSGPIYGTVSEDITTQTVTPTIINIKYTIITVKKEVNRKCYTPVCVTGSRQDTSHITWVKNVHIRDSLMI